jgi:L-threonylcarbamoyladenylate synthase
VTIHAADADSIAAAAQHLRAGELVAFPTETVYGLGADATNAAAIAKIYALKKRPAFNPLIVHIAAFDWLETLATTDDRAVILAKVFWPGPLTLVLPRSKTCAASKLVSPNLETIAVRQPKHPIATHLLNAVERPLAAPSANLSGHVSPTLAAHVEADFGAALDLILDGGPCQTGLESTVLDLSTATARLLRPGAISAAEITAHIGPIGTSDAITTAEDLKSPGQLEKHYAPSVPVRLEADAAKAGEALIGFGSTANADINLSPVGDLTEAAANLFHALRNLDDPKRFSGIAVAPIPKVGIGIAINDRLRRAALGR